MSRRRRPARERKAAARGEFSPNQVKTPECAHPSSRSLSHQAALIHVALCTVAPGGLVDGATIYFPPVKNRRGAPPMAAVLTKRGNALTIGGIHHHGQPFTFEPDGSTAALIRHDIERLARPESIDPETGIPIFDR